MSALTPASEVILRHDDHFSERHLLLAGDIQDQLATELQAKSVRVHTNQYHHWQALSRTLGENAAFGLTVPADFVAQCDTLIYFWPKSKQDAQFQLEQLFSILPVGCDIFIVGENRSGVRSAEKIAAPYANMQKIDTARRCGLYHAELTTAAHFNQDEWWRNYSVANSKIWTLPGVFSQDDMDIGSRLLLETCQDRMKGSLLDIACGAGVIATVLGLRHPDLKLTLSDVSAPALAASEKTLAENGLKGQIIASDVYSEIKGYFDWIITNPPFHDGLNTHYDTTVNLISQAKKHLNRGGKLRLVANAFLPYPAMLDAAFGQHEVLAQTGKFKVYQATKY